jgi:hypothetical protein
MFIVINLLYTYKMDIGYQDSNKSVFRKPVCDQKIWYVFKK